MSSSRTNVSPTVLVCRECGTEAPIWRKSSKRKKQGHVKHMWCHACEKVTAHVEACGWEDE